MKTEPVQNIAEPRVGELYRETFDLLGRVLDAREPRLEAREIGTVVDVGQGVARVTGLPNVRSNELLQFSGRRYGLAFNLLRHEVGCVLLDQREAIQAGSEVRRTGRVLDVPVSDALLGRVIDPLGRPLDELGAAHAEERWPVERPAPAIMDRLPVTVPLQTGVKVIDSLIPIGRGQRELILGDRQTGKTGIAVDAMINQRDKGVLCIYCAIGQQSTAVARVIDSLKQFEALAHTVVVVAEADSPPGLQFVAPYAATSIGEFFMEHGRDVLIVYDDLTTHARAYRELSLLLRRPPGREAFPGDIFYIHSRLLERSTHLREELGGGSLTALPIAETEAQNVSAYIPTNLISITDGQVYLSPELFRKGVLPAVDVGRSVSRVGGKTQFPAYRMVAGDLRLSYSQFEELERFARFSSQLDEETRRTLAHGRRVREALKQPLYQPIPAAEQIAVLVAVTSGAFDELPPDSVPDAERRVREWALDELPDVCERIEQGQKLEETDRDELERIVREAAASFREDSGDGDAPSPPASRRWDDDWRLD